MARDVVVRPPGTAWGSVLGGWLATLGVAALLSPLVSLVLTNVLPLDRSLASTVPVIIAIGIAYLIGGHVAGRMAGYRTSWHGMLTAFFGLFVVLAMIVIAVAVQQGVFGPNLYLPEILPPLVSVSLYPSAESLAFGGLIGMLLAIFAAWLGGLLAPTRTVAVVATEPVREAHESERVVTADGAHPVEADGAHPVEADGAHPVETERVVRPPAERRRFRLLPSVGRKGGERSTRAATVEPDRKV